MLNQKHDKVVDADLDALRLLMLDTIYPVGSIYMSVNNVSPSTLFGGTWEAIEDRFLLAAGSTYTAGDTGGEATHILTTAETPAHTHTRGTMEITGSVAPAHSSGVCWYNVAHPDGAFTTSESVSNCGIPNLKGTFTGDHILDFTASRSWTGETSSVGGGEAHNNMPPYLAVYIWKRVS